MTSLVSSTHAYTFPSCPSASPTSSSNTHGASPARFPTKFRLKHARSTKGCFTCRQRKKKCEGSRPLCDGCKRNSLECSWPEAGKATSHATASQANSNAATSPMPPAKSPPSHSHPGTLLNSQAISLLDANQAYRLNSESALFLRHYVSETAVALSVGPSNINPFITHVLPPAYTDSVVMHAILAMSGAHLEFKLGGAVSVQLATWQHYMGAIQGVRDEIARLDRKGPASIRRLCLALYFLSQYEIISGGSTSTLKMHLGAIGQILAGYANHGAFFLDETNETDEVLGLAYAGYSYLSSSNEILPCAVGDGVPPDWSQTPFTLLENCVSHEFVFAGSHGLFKLIPQVKTLYHLRLAEEASGLSEPSPTLRVAHDRLKARIESWQMETEPDPGSAATTLGLSASNPHRLLQQTQTERRNAAECIRYALRIYIILSLAGSSVSFQLVNQHRIQNDVEAVLFIAATLTDSPYLTHTMWAIVVVGSCLINESLRTGLAEGLTNSRYRMRHLSTLRKVLELLWADPDPRAYGPYGLMLIIQKHNLDLSVL